MDRTAVEGGAASPGPARPGAPGFFGGPGDVPARQRSSALSVASGDRVSVSSHTFAARGHPAWTARIGSWRPPQQGLPSATGLRGSAYTGRRAPQDVVLGITLLYVQAVLAVLFLGLVRYERGIASGSSHSYYSRDDHHLFQDVHVMIFAGFGFLMVFLRRYCYSSVGLVLLLGAILVQWSILVLGFFRIGESGGTIPVSMLSLLNADVATATVLISMGAVLGRTTPLQLLVMGVIEMVFYGANEYLAGHVFKANDVGGSMYVHVFGAYFGLAVSRALGRPAAGENENSSYTSDIIAMVGTVFLWLFWPSFNGALCSGAARHRAVLNTYLSLASCCVSAFAVSSLTQRDSKFSMVHVQNATLAGGVAMGTAADLLVQPVGALAVGCLAGLISVLGYAYLQPFLLKRLKIHDTCGVHNLHGMPGVLGGLVGAIMAALATENEYGKSLYLQFPAMTPSDSEKLSDLREYLGMQLQAGDSRSPGQQAAYQICALVVTWGISIVSGTGTGFNAIFYPGYIIRQSRLLRQTTKEELFDDAASWIVPDDPLPQPPSSYPRKISVASVEAGQDVSPL